MNSSHDRLRRGRVAKLLHTMHAAGQLDGPASWTFDRLGTVPDWCLRDSDARMQLQYACGALLLAPLMRLWIDAGRLRTAQGLLGTGLFQLLQNEDAVPTLNTNTTDLLDSLMGWTEQVGEGTVELMLREAGAIVLIRSVNDVILRQQLSGVVTDESSTRELLEHDALSVATAEALTALASTLLDKSFASHAMASQEAA